MIPLPDLTLTNFNPNNGQNEEEIVRSPRTQSIADHVIDPNTSSQMRKSRLMFNIKFLEWFLSNLRDWCSIEKVQIAFGIFAHLRLSKG